MSYKQNFVIFIGNNFAKRTRYNETGINFCVGNNLLTPKLTIACCKKSWPGRLWLFLAADKGSNSIGYLKCKTQQWCMAQTTENFIPFWKQKPMTLSSIMVLSRRISSLLRFPKETWGKWRAAALGKFRTCCILEEKFFFWFLCR